VNALLGEPEGHSAGRAILTGVLVGVVTLSVAGVIFETLDWLATAAGHLFRLVETLSVTVLSAEYLLRLWAAPERDPTGTAQPWRARLDYVVSFAGIIDLLAILPAFLHLVVPIPTDWLRVLRLLRLLKITRYAPGLTLFAAVLHNEARALLATLLVVLVLLVLESAVMYTLERETQPKVFASIPHSMWWAIVTIATVGYGDMVPMTPAGRAFGGLVMVIGIAVFAVPAGILATGFANEIRKRDFVVTWRTVANVPLFAGLDATRIAEIARLLKPQVVPAHYAVVRRGEPADAMFFIMGGEVQVDVAPTPVRLGKGQYFGEIALLRDSVRTATVTAVSECQLLSLDVGDFRRLLESNPTLKATVTRVADERLPAPSVTPPPQGESPSPGPRR
jgi:voltage-gated potassium channel